MLLRVTNLKKHYGGVTAVNDVSFDLVRNEILAVVGPNGAGKTTLFGLICSFIGRDAGSVWSDGQDVTGMPPHRIAKPGMVRSFQIVQVFPDLTMRSSRTWISRTSVTISRLRCRSRAGSAFNWRSAWRQVPS